MFKLKCVSLSLLSLLLLIMAGCMGGNSFNSNSNPANSTGSHNQAGKLTANGGPDIVGGGAGGAGQGLNGMLGGGGGRGEAGPLTLQSMFDYTQTGIEPWGPVVNVIQVQKEGQTYNLNLLASTDPFTAMYQLENGDIVFSNEPPEDLVGTLPAEPTLPTEVWNGPEGAETIYSGQIMALFKPEVTQAQIEQFIDDHNLHVIFSWFEPPEQPGEGNAIGVFQFEYDPVEFATFNAAYTYFQANALMASAMPNYVEAFEVDYTPLPANDWFYQIGQNRHISVLGIDSVTSEVNIGPPYGAQLSNVSVAVFDDGVYRASEDLIAPGSPPTSKISWVGITCYPKKAICGFLCGEPTKFEDHGERLGALVTHGTQVAGTITASTRSNEVGSAGVAPQIGVLPVRLEISKLNPETFNFGSYLYAIVAMRKCVQHNQWLEKVRVINTSFGGDRADVSGFLEKMINRDIARADRLHVASAGNEYLARKRYPAALPAVLGVSGLWTTLSGPVAWYKNVIDGRPEPGSNYYIDPPGTPPEDRVYPVSGIFGFTDAGRASRYPFAQLPSTRLIGSVDPFYWNFSGTSFAAPQVAGLAALLYDQDNRAHYWEVSNHIVQYRQTGVEATTYPLAGPIDVNQALSNWP